MREFNAVIIENTRLSAGIFNLWLKCGFDFNAVPGQFINIYLDRQDMLLPRPISICDIKSGAIRLAYQIAGKGTEYLSRLKPGSNIRAVGPLGNGFWVEPGSGGKPLIIGGGIGVPPLLFLAKTLKPALAVLGFRSASSVILADEFLSLGCETIISTDDGSLGYKGYVTDAAETFADNKEISAVYACGPRPMLKSAAEYAGKNNMPCQVSMEEHMGCGIGACLCCPVAILENNEKIYKKLCKDGPVFNAGSVVWGGAV